MKYIVFSDIHSNLQALEAVAEDFVRQKADKIFCAGDIVGYGAQPNECAALISSIASSSIAGNHEDAVLGRIDTTFFNEFAASAVAWTKENLDKKGYEYISGLPYVLAEGNMTAAHGTLHSPREFRYMLNCDAATRTFEEMASGVCFVGHTHVPGVFVYRNGNIYQTFSEKVNIEDNDKYIINTGSVGQPRDKDPRACYCVYDTDRSIVEFRRVEYDIRTARSKIVEAGLPQVLGDRLLLGR
jgi:diadenosine tetraphosphatase ApaH/serine/threonine PP2A family protein phosphatase